MGFDFSDKDDSSSSSSTHQLSKGTGDKTTKRSIVGADQSKGKNSQKEYLQVPMDTKKMLVEHARGKQKERANQKVGSQTPQSPAEGTPAGNKWAPAPTMGVASQQVPAKGAASQVPAKGTTAHFPAKGTTPQISTKGTSAQVPAKGKRPAEEAEASKKRPAKETLKE
ncbi:PREDICTED: uncharacterized protein LOC104607758 [Nelumbo nucifera]|uniref:Uncharacterized protein LOC104607758 n=1 Tax=Nelumbo nucifera TaxID=4432 RepID=A0A1U8AYE2_NELNU|nr:PREDICTED: uncharacterized protein LOC104607758 [Nelumbo nucifera]